MSSDSDDLWYELHRMRNRELCEHENVNDMIANDIKQFSICSDCGKIWSPDGE